MQYIAVIYSLICFNYWLESFRLAFNTQMTYVHQGNLSCAHWWSIVANGTTQLNLIKEAGEKVKGDLSTEVTGCQWRWCFTSEHSSAAGTQRPPSAGTCKLTGRGKCWSREWQEVKWEKRRQLSAALACASIPCPSFPYLDSAPAK